MKVGYNLNTYTSWDFHVPYCTLIVFLLHALVIYISIAFFTYTGSHEIVKHIYNFVYLYSKAVLRGSLKFVHRRNSDERQLLLHDEYKIKQHHLLALLTCTSMVLWPVFISFWASFLIDETFVCDPLLDCFLGKTGFEFHSEPPLDNCTNINENATLICFQFVFDYTGGFASAVGFLAVAVIYIRVYNSSLIWLAECILMARKSTVHSKGSKCIILLFSYCVLVVLLITPIVSSVLVITLAFKVPLFHGIILRSHESTLKFFAYCVCFFWIGPALGVYELILITKAKKKQPNRNIQW